MGIQRVLTDWSFEPSVVIGVALAALLYWRGVVYSRRRGLARHWRWWQGVAFTAGLLVVFVALESALDDLAGQLLWAHMVQHELLVIVAAPLLLLGAPAWPSWRGVPLGARRATLGWVIRQGWPRTLWHRVSRWLTVPALAWVLYNGVFATWHIPALYDYAVEHQPVHVLEHLMFLAVALLFWAQVIPSRPMKPRMSYPQQAIYLGATGLFSNVMGAVFTFSIAPMYPFYAALPRPTGSLALLADQHLAGAAMDVPGMIIFFVATLTIIGLWLQADEREGGDLPATIPAGRVSRSSGTSAS